jgi:NAD(P)-dependent dehydrogenase (short-subunit alcohol dehydrogenase family)
LNAGIAKFADLAAVTEAFFDEIFDINVRGFLFTAQAALPYLKSGGSIVVNTSVNAHMGMAGTLVYGASKAAAATMVRVLAGELAPLGIRVNAVCPGPIETPIYGKLGLPAEQLQAVAGGLVEKIPLKRFGKADEVARAALYLASEESSFVTGQELIVDGGWLGVVA